MSVLRGPVLALLCGALCVIFGQGQLNLLVSMCVVKSGAPAWVTGAMTSAYYVGLVLGAWMSPRLVIRVGHVRAFTMVTVMLASVAVSHTFGASLWGWALLRVLSGFGFAVLMLVIDSWLNASTDSGSRGVLMAVNMVVYYLAMGAGQFVLSWTGIEGRSPFLWSALCMAASMAFLVMCRGRAPKLTRARLLPPGVLLRRAPLGVAGVLASGVTMGGIFGLGAVYGEQVGLTEDGVSVLMGLLLIGGLLLQWPAGWISDRVGRGHVLVGAASLVVPVCAALVWSGAGPWMSVWALLLGGLLATFYPLAVSLTNDRLEREEMVSAAGWLVLGCGAGSMVGPWLSALLMAWLGSGGLFAGIGLCGASLLVVALSARVVSAWPRGVRSASEVVVEERC